MDILGIPPQAIRLILVDGYLLEGGDAEVVIQPFPRLLLVFFPSTRENRNTGA